MATKDEMALTMVMTVLHSPTIFETKPFSIERREFISSDLAVLIGDIGAGKGGNIHIKIKSR